MAREYFNGPEKAAAGEFHEKPVLRKVEAPAKPQEKWDLHSSKVEVTKLQLDVERLQASLDQARGPKEVAKFEDKLEGARAKLVDKIKSEMVRCASSHENQAVENYGYVKELERTAELYAGADVESDIYEKLNREETMKLEHLKVMAADKQKAEALSKEIAGQDETWDQMVKTAQKGSLQRAAMPGAKESAFKKTDKEAEALEQQMKASKAIKAQGWLAKAYGKVAGLFQPSEYKEAEGPTKEDLKEMGIRLGTQLIKAFDKIQSLSSVTENPHLFSSSQKDRDKLFEKITAGDGLTKKMFAQLEAGGNVKISDREIYELALSEMSKAVAKAEEAWEKAVAENVRLSRLPSDAEVSAQKKMEAKEGKLRQREAVEAKERQELVDISRMVDEKLVGMFDSLQTAEGWTEDEAQMMFKEIVDKGKLADRIAERINYANAINVTHHNPKLDERQTDEFIRSFLMKAVKDQEAVAKKSKVEFVPLPKADAEYLKKIGGVGKFDSTFQGSYEDLYKQIQGQVFSLLKGEEAFKGIKDSQLKSLIEDAYKNRQQLMKNELMSHMRLTKKDNVVRAFQDKFTPNFMANELKEEIEKERNA